MLPQNSTSWPRQLFVQSMTRDFEDFCFGQGVHGRSLETQVGKYLKRMVPGIQSTRPGRTRNYVFPSLAECLAAFGRATTVSWEWPNDDVEK